MSILMKNQKPKPKQTNAEAVKKSRIGKKNFNVWVEFDLRDAFNDLLKKSRRDITAEVSIAIEKHLTSEGLWPPKSDAKP